jgi:ABC-type branched-subunit amino acid transport system substrate-binding protein
MRTLIVIVLSSVVAVLVPTGETPAQQSLAFSERAEKVFREGVTQFERGMFEEAAMSFARVIGEFPLNQRTTAAHIMRAKALLRLQETLEAARTLRRFLEAFPTSTYRADAEYMLGLTYARIQRHDDALQSLLRAWRSIPPVDGSARLQRLILAALDATIDNHLSVLATRQLVEGSMNVDERYFFLLKVGEKEAARGNITGASVVMDELAAMGPHPRWVERVASLKTRIEQRSSVKLGLLLPIMRNAEPSAVKEIGTEVHEGAIFAHEEYESDPATRVKVFLEVRDTERKPLTAARGVQELTADDDVIGIIGPVFSATTSAAVGVASARGVPLITPTANTNGIAASGAWIFQANPDYETRGRAMARFAVLNKGYRRLAVLAPIDTYGKFLAEAFIAECTRLGATVVASEWYQRGAADLTRQLSNIRRTVMIETTEPILTFAGRLNQRDIAMLIAMGVPKRTVDSLIERSATIEASKLLGADAKRIIDSLEIAAQYHHPHIDSLEYPVETLDALYAPISSPEEIGVVSSQVVYFNFRTQILGSGEWNNFQELNQNRRYSNGVIFESDYHVDPQDQEYASFVERFFARFKKRPGKNTLYGYDATKLVLRLIHEGATTREALQRSLSAVNGYKGLHSRITLSSERVNTWLMVLQYRADHIEKIADIDVGQPVVMYDHGKEEGR